MEHGVAIVQLAALMFVLTEVGVSPGGGLVITIVIDCVADETNVGLRTTDDGGGGGTTIVNCGVTTGPLNGVVVGVGDGVLSGGLTLPPPPPPPPQPESASIEATIRTLRMVGNMLLDVRAALLGESSPSWLRFGQRVLTMPRST
jgi:hypothetical protein